MKEEGLRFNEGKLRYDLIHPVAQEGLVRVLTAGAEKYGDSNWTKGMAWSKVIASLKRHLAAIEGGADFDSETLEYHANHLQCNAHFLSAYYSIYPQGDDRQNTFFDKRVALDIDGVLAAFSPAFCKKMGVKNRNNHWHFTYEWKRHGKELSEDKDFWLNLEPMIKGSELPFEPVAYVTHRDIPVEWCEEWLEKNGFPCEPVHVVKESKVDVLKELEVDIFVDDAYKNFVELNNAGIFTYLFSTPYNEKYDVGHKRIHSLDEVVSKALKRTLK
jgi:uncharacterized HAD superfamily protein